MKLFSKKGTASSGKKQNEKEQSADNVSVHSADSNDGPAPTIRHAYQINSGEIPPVPPKELLDAMFNDVAVC
jgi:hypothetical protein